MTFQGSGRKQYRSRRPLWAVGLLALLLVAAPASATVDVPPYPSDLDLSSVEKLFASGAYRVEVRAVGAADFHETRVFETRNDWVLLDFFGPDPTRVRRGAGEFGLEKGQMRTASFANFSFRDTAVEVRITLLDGRVARSATVRPLRHDIHPDVSPDGKVIRFTLTRPLKVSVDVNDRLNPLFLFADSPDEPDPQATYYFGPGVHRLPGDGRLTLKTGERVYIAAGAIVEGHFSIEAGSSNVTIRGRGILSTGEWPHTSARVKWLTPHATFYSAGTDHFTLEGLTLVQGSAWTIAIDDDNGHCTHENLYQNLNMVHWAGNTDAFWITGERNRVDDCFVMNNDDLIVSKGGGDCHVSNVVFWGGSWGRLMLLFDFGRPIHDILIENVDVIGKGETPHFILAEHLRGRAPIEVTNLTFRNVRIEDRAAPTLKNPECLFRLDGDQSKIRATGLRFENVTLDQQVRDEGVIAAAPDRPWNDLTFVNLRMGGRLIESAEQSHIRFSGPVNNVRFVVDPLAATRPSPRDAGAKPTGTAP